MTRTDLLTALRELNPEKANLSDEQLLWDAGSKAQQDGSIDQYPALQTEMIRQQAAYESADNGLVGNAYAAVKRGFARGAQGANAAAGMDDTNAQDIADWENVAAANPNSPEYTDFMQAKGFADSNKAFWKAPVRILSELMAESASQSLPAMAGGFLGGAAQGAAAGMGVGSAVTAPVGAMIGTAAGSGYVEYGSKLLSVMQEAGMDASDPESVKQFFNDPVRLANAKDLALKRAIPVAIFDGVSMGLSAKFAEPVVDAWRSGAALGTRKVAGAIGTGLAIEAGGGMAGELGGQLAAGENLDMKSIAVEGLAEMGGLPSSVASGALSNYRAPAQAVEAPAVAQQEATVQQRAPLQAEFGDVATTTPVPAPEAVPVVTETEVAPTVAKNAPVLATPAQQQMMVDTGEVQPDEAATFTISQAKAFLDDFADRQAAVEELNQDTSQEAAIEAAVAQQSAARNLAAQQVAAEQAQLKADQEAMAQQARDFATARSNRIAAQQAQLAAQRNAVSSLDNNEGVAFQQMIGSAAPAMPAVQRNAAPSVLAQRQAADAQKAVAQTAVQQKKMFTAKAAATVASAAPVNTIAPVTAPLTRAVPVAEAAQTMSPKLASVNVAQPATEAAQQAPIAPVAQVAPVATPVADVAVSEPVAPVARMRDEFTTNNAVVAHSALVEPGATVESVAEVANLRKARAQVSGHNTNALVVLQDSNGEYHQVPIKQKAGSSKFYAQVHASRGEWISWVAEEAGVGRGSVDPALGGNSKLAAATVARIKDVASKYGYGQDKNTDLTKWLESNPQLRPVAYVTTEQPVQRGFRKANMEAVTAVIRQLDERKNAAAAAGTLPSESVPVIHSEAALEKVEAAVGDSPAEQVRELLGNKYYSLIEKLASIRDSKASSKDPKAGIKAAKAALDKVLLNYPEVRQAVVSVKGGYNAILDSLPENAATKKKVDSIAYPGSSSEAVAARQALADVLFAITDADLRSTALSHMAKNPGAARDAIVAHRKSNPKLAESMRLMTVDQRTAFYDALDNEVKAMADAAAVTVKNGSATMTEVLNRIESAPVRETSKDFLDATDRFNNVLRSAAARGINIVQREATKFFKAGGAYVPSTRGISLVLDNVLSPSASNLLTLVHEVTHDITETAPEPIRRALHDAFERIPAGELAFYGNPMADPRLSDGSLTGEALITERMVEHLSVQGIDREYSTGVIATIYRSVKDVLLRGAMYLQGKLLGESNVSGELAKEWAENQVAAFIAGDKVRTQNFLQQFGITPQIGTVVRAVADDYSVVHFGTDGVSYERIPGADAINIAAAISGVKETAMANGTWTLDRDLKELSELLPAEVMQHVEPMQATREIASRIVQATQRELRIKAAAANALRPILESLLKKVKGSQIEYTAAQKAQFKRDGRPLPTAINEMADLMSVLEMRDPSFAAAKAETEAKKMLEAETGEEITGPLVNSGTTLEQLENGEIGEADREIASYISTLLGKTLVKKTSLEETILKLSTGETSNRALIQSITANLNDTRITVNEMLRNIASNFDSLRRGMKRVDGLSEAKGEAEATLDALLSEAERREMTQERMEKALNSIDIKELPLGAALRDLYNLGLELDTAPVSEIRSRVKEAVLLNPDSPLAAFVSIGEGPNAGLRGTVLLSSMIQFVKSEALTAEVLRAQMGRTKDDVAQLNEVRGIFQETNTDKLTELANQMRAFRPTGNADKLGDQPIPTPRLAHRMLKAWEKALKKQIQLAEAERDLSILRAALPAFTTLDRQAAQRLSVGNNFQFHSGSMYMDPKDPTTSEEFLTAAPNLKPLLLSGPQAMPADKLRDLRNRTQAWLDARESDPSLQGEVYQTMKRQLREITKNMYGDKIHKLVSGIFNGRLEGLAHLFIKSGTRSGEVAARMLVRFEGIGRLFAPKDSTNGQRWETLRDNVIRLMEIEPQQMKEMFSDPARTLMQWFQGTEREAFAVLETRFNGEPATAEFFSKPGVSAAFFEMMRDIPKQNAYLLEKMAHAGADRVLDPKLGGKERTHIDTGVPGYTTPMGVTRELRNWLHSFEHSFAIGEDASNPFRQVTRLLATNDGVNTMRASLARLFDDSGWTTFLRPLIENEAGGVPKPIGTDEIATIIHPDDAKELLAQSGNDLLNFADAAFKRFGDGTEDGQRAYRETIVNWVNKTWASLDTQFVHREKTPFRGMLSVPEVSINARAAATYPSQWMTHVEFTPGDQRRLTHAVAMTGVFGRNGETMSKLVADIHTSLDSEKNELTALKTDADWEALKKLDKPKYDKLRELQKYYVPDYDKQVGDIFNTESDAFVENKTILEIFAGMTAGMTAGMKSALKNLVTGANLLYLQRSVSGEALTTVGGAYAKTGKVFAAAMADCFGIRLFRNDPFVQAMNRAGAYDSATRTTLKDLITGERGVDDNLSQFCRVLRMTRNVLTQTRLSPLSKDSPFTAMRAFNPFQFTQLAVNMANTWQLMQDYHSLATGAAGFYKAGGDTKATLTAKDCGVQDATRFEALRSRMLDNGLSLEDLGKRIAAGKDILDGDFIQACNNISSGDLANEGGINNRPTAMSRSKMGRVAGTFVGWAIAQTQHPLRLMSSPEGRTDLMTLANATKVFALGILPMSLAFSAALDDWDELVGRKSNRRPLRLSDPQSISEAVVNVGTIGMLGDAVDFVSNTAQGTSGNSNLLSLDNRIVIVSSANAMITAVRNAAAMGDVNYANVARPLLQGMGAGGLLQNAYLMDRVLGLQNIPVIGSPFQAESSVVLRGNIQNYLRAAGREAGLEVRMAGGGGYTPTPMTPKVTDMLLAALRDDRSGFQTAYREAIKVAQAAGHPDPLKKVQEAFTARHPLKSLFNGTPTAAEVQKMMASMPDEGKRAVTDSLRLVNNYGASLGVAPFMGSPTMSGAQVVRQRKGVLEAMQARLAQDRGLF